MIMAGVGDPVAYGRAGFGLDTAQCRIIGCAVSSLREMDMADRLPVDLTKIRSTLTDVELLGYRVAENGADRSDPAQPKMRRVKVGSVKGGFCKT